MQNLLKNEWNKIKLPFSITFLLSVIAVCVVTSIAYKSYALEAQLEVYEVGFPIFNLIFPLLAVVPTAWLMYFERKTNFVIYTLPRVKQRTYILTKSIVSMLTGFLIVFGISIASVIIAIYVVPPVIQTSFSFNSSTGEPILIQDKRLFGEVFVYQPFLYGFVLSVWKGLIASLMALFGFVLSLYSRNLFVILAGPFMYMILDNFVWNLIGPRKYNLVTAFEPSSISVDYLTWVHFVLPPIQLGIVITSYVLYMHFKLKKSVYEL